MRFRVNEAVRHEAYDAVLGKIEESFAEGPVTPKNEAQEAALTKLVDLGLAELVDDSTPDYRNPPAPEPETETEPEEPAAEKPKRTRRAK